MRPIGNSSLKKAWEQSSKDKIENRILDSLIPMVFPELVSELKGKSEPGAEVVALTRESKSKGKPGRLIGSSPFP